MCIRDRYVADEMKTENPKWDKSSLENLTDVMHYAADEDKTEKQFFVTGINCSAEIARDQFVTVKKQFNKGIWLAAPGTVLVVISLFLIAGYNNTAYYPSTADIQSSLTLSNSCSSEFTLRAMAIVSLIIPFVVAYIAYFWRKMDTPSLTKEELKHSERY